MGAIELIVLALATWRVSSLLVREQGPFFIFQRLRGLTGITHDPFGGLVKIPDTFFAGILSCVWCASIWVGAGWVLAWYFLPKITVLVATIFALSSGAIVLDRLFEGRTLP